MKYATRIIKTRNPAGKFRCQVWNDDRKDKQYGLVLYQCDPLDTEEQAKEAAREWIKLDADFQSI
jgi:hypothetical protein